MTHYCPFCKTLTMNIIGAVVTGRNMTTGEFIYSHLKQCDNCHKVVIE